MRIPSIRKSSVGVYALRLCHELSIGYGDSCCHFRFILDHNCISLQISQTGPNIYGSDDHASIYKVAEGLTVDGILENWSKLKPVIMEAWAENRDPLIDLFGKVRDEWMEKDFPAWIGANRY